MILMHAILTSGQGLARRRKFIGRTRNNKEKYEWNFAVATQKQIVIVINGRNGTFHRAGRADEVFNDWEPFQLEKPKEFRIRVKKDPKIEIITNHVPIEIKGEKFVKTLVIEDIATKQRREIQLQGIFSEIGWETHTAMVQGLVEVNQVGEIIVDTFCRTKTPGLYACGDLTMTPYKQTVISAGMGAVATLEAYRFITTGKVSE